jgi:A/G-specific adenine glycosylase
MQAITRKLLTWYRKNRIPYPWRRTTDPYPVWLSEILLQQTRIPVVLQYYDKILKRFPNLRSLAQARDGDFLATWSGVGYYRRAKNMLACARQIVSNHNGKFPQDRESLLNLPGIGRYTAGAIRNLCFGLLTPAIDGNIRRVLTRITEQNIEDTFVAFGAEAPASEYFQAWMELGEQICLPAPKCSACPIPKYCSAYKNGTTERRPLSKKKTATYHWYFLLLKKGEATYYVRNSQREFLKEAWIFPDVLSSTGLTNTALIRELQRKWDIRFSKIRKLSTIRHTVTFRKIHAHIFAPEGFRTHSRKGKWLTPEQLSLYPTSSITRKVLKLQTHQINDRESELF